MILVSLLLLTYAEPLYPIPASSGELSVDAEISEENNSHLTGAAPPPVLIRDQASTGSNKQLGTAQSDDIGIAQADGTLTVSDGSIHTIRDESKNFTRIVVVSHSILVVHNATLLVAGGVEVIDSAMNVTDSEVEVGDFIAFRGDSNGTFASMVGPETAVHLLGETQLTVDRSEVGRVELDESSRLWITQSTFGDVAATVSAQMAATSSQGGAFDIRGSSNVTLIESQVGDVTCAGSAVFKQMGGLLNNAEVTCARFEVAKSADNQRTKFNGRLTVTGNGNATVSDAEGVKPVAAYSAGQHTIGVGSLPAGPSVSFSLTVDSAGRLELLRSRVDFWTLLCSGSAVLDIRGLNSANKVEIGEIDCSSMGQISLKFVSVDVLALRGSRTIPDTVTESDIGTLNLFDLRWVNLVRSRVASHLRTYNESQASVFTSLEIGSLELFGDSAVVIDSASRGVGPFKLHQQARLIVEGQTNAIEGEAFDSSTVQISSGDLDFIGLHDNSTFTARNMVAVNRVEAFDYSRITVESNSQGGTARLADNSEMRLQSSTFAEVFIFDSAKFSAVNSYIRPDGVVIIGTPASETGVLPTAVLNSSVAGNIIAVKDFSLQMNTDSRVTERMLVVLSSQRSSIRLGGAGTPCQVVLGALEVLVSNVTMHVQCAYIETTLFAASSVKMTATEFLSLTDVRRVPGRMNINDATLYLAGNFTLRGFTDLSALGTNITFRGNSSITREYLVRVLDSRGQPVSGTTITYSLPAPPTPTRTCLERIDGGHRICFVFSAQTVSKQIVLDVEGKTATIDLRTQTPVDIVGVTVDVFSYGYTLLVVFAVVAAVIHMRPRAKRRYEAVRPLVQ